MECLEGLTGTGSDVDELAESFASVLIGRSLGSRGGTRRTGIGVPVQVDLTGLVPVMASPGSPALTVGRVATRLRDDFP